MLGVLLYGSETWTTMRAVSKRLEVFHDWCLKGILGITAMQQWSDHLSSVEIARQFGMEESLEDLITARRLRWLGHVARMKEERVQKKLLFGWLPQRRPAHGTKMRWRDRARKDLKKFGVNERCWYSEAQERGRWRQQCKEGLVDATERRLREHDNHRRMAALSVPTLQPFTCNRCRRSFRRGQDIARHRCVTTRPRS